MTHTTHKPVYFSLLLCKVVPRPRWTTRGKQNLSCWPAALLIATLAAMVFGSDVACYGQGRYETLAETQLPTGTGGEFSTFLNAQINNSGQVAFQSGLQNTPQGGADDGILANFAGIGQIQFDNGVARIGSLTNDASIQALNGTNHIFGDVDNSGTGLIDVNPGVNLTFSLLGLGLVLGSRRRRRRNLPVRKTLGNPSHDDATNRYPAIPLATIVIALGLVVGSIAAPSVSAQTTTWLGDTGNWTDAANWSNGVPVFTALIDNGNAANSDVLYTGDTEVFDMVLDDGDKLRIGNGSRLNFAGGGVLINNGLIDFEGTGFTGIRIDGDLTIGGNGTIRLTDGQHNIVGSGNPMPLLTNGIGHTIEGIGKVGSSGINVSNQGLLHANITLHGLTIDSGTLAFDNTGTVRVSNGGRINMFSGTNVGVGLYEATGAGSTVYFFGTSVSDATFNGSNGGLVFKNGSGMIDLHNVTNLGAFRAQSVGLFGSLNNQGRFTLVNGSNNNIVLANDIHVTGGGTIDFSQGGTAATGSGKFFADDVTLEGFGHFDTETEFAAASILAPGISTDATTSFDFNAPTLVDGNMLIELGGIDVNFLAPDVNLVNTETGTSQFAMGGLEFDQLNVFNSALFSDSALLDVQLANGFIPEFGDFFDVLTADEFGFLGPLDTDLPVINGLTFSTEILNLFDTSTGTNRDVFRLTYGAATVPEPGPFALMGILGAVSVLIRRRSHNRSRQLR